MLSLWDDCEIGVFRVEERVYLAHSFHRGTPFVHLLFRLLIGSLTVQAFLRPLRERSR